MTSGVFSRCKLFLLQQHIFLIFTQPSWDGYLLLYGPKYSIRGTTIDLRTYENQYFIIAIYLGIVKTMFRS